MKSIVFTHVAAPAEGAAPLDVALDRLGAWLDAEHETLGRVLVQSGRTHACGVLEALDELHLEPWADAADLRALLEEAHACLEFLLETLRAIPSGCRLATAWGLPGSAPFHSHLRWSAARLTDILATLDHALAA